MRGFGCTDRELLGGSPCRDMPIFVLTTRPSLTKALLIPEHFQSHAGGMALSDNLEDMNIKRHLERHAASSATCANSKAFPRSDVLRLGSFPSEYLCARRCCNKCFLLLFLSPGPLGYPPLTLLHFHMGSPNVYLGHPTGYEHCGLFVFRNQLPA